MLDLYRIKSAVIEFRQRRTQNGEHQQFVTEIDEFDVRMKRQGKSDVEIAQTLIDAYKIPIDELASDLQVGLTTEKAGAR